MAVRASNEAIAVVGLACRLPGGINGPDDLWAALVEGREVIGRVPADRFEAARWLDADPARPGKTYSVAGAFLDDVRGFDAGYFRVPPRVADRMDPQQRLLLELAVEALDCAGIDGDALAGSDTAVYVGASSRAYAFLQGLEARSADAATPAGGAGSAIAAGVSRFLDLRGPSLVVDTACSSSLVALHQACEALRSGRCGTALAAGVHVLLDPFEYVGLAKASLLSPTGHCRPFSAEADGYVRAEGGGLVVLKPLRAAIADGDRVHAVILGTGVGAGGCGPHPRCSGADGCSGAGARACADAQEALLRDVHAAAGVDSDEMAYLEMHAAGLPGGDAAECRAVGRAFGTRRTEGRHLAVGSVKGNLGHLEPASGMAGLLKALLVLRHRRVPATAHAGPLNRDIDFARWRLAPATASAALDVPDGARAVVGVNSFGFGGVDAHAVLADHTRATPTARARSKVPGPERGTVRLLPVVVSARTPAAAAEGARRMADRLERCEAGEFYDIAHTACRRRGTHAYRAAVLAAAPAEAARRLRALAEEGPNAPERDVPERGGAEQDAFGQGAPEPAGAGAGSDASARGEAGPDAGRPGAAGAWATGVARGSVALAFCGDGALCADAGDGADLPAADPVFRAAVREADDALAPLLGWSVSDELARPAAARRPRTTDVTQPLLFAVQVGVVGVLRAYGLRPAAVVGHGAGEVAAAWAAGVLDLDAAARVVVERSRAQAATVGDWGTAALTAPLARARHLLAPYAGRIGVAALDSDRDVTVSGDKAALALLEQDCARDGVAFRDLGIDHALHSHAVDGVQEPLRAALADVKPARAHVPYASATTGTVLAGPEMDARYWWHNLRDTVRFGPAVARLHELGCDMFVDVGPHPVLAGHLRRLAGGHGPCAVVPTLRRGTPGPEAVTGALAHLVAGGARMEPGAFFPRPGRVVDLPGYPWQRTPHWNGGPRAWSGGGSVDHPLLGERAPVAEPTWHGPFEPGRLPWLADHRVGGRVVMPAAGYVEMMLSAGRRVLDAPVQITGLTMPAALPLPYDDATAHLDLQTSLASDDGLTVVAGRTEPSGPWRHHARARIHRLDTPAPEPRDIQRLMAGLPAPLPADAHYRTDADGGTHRGPAFRVLRRLRVADDEMLARYAGPDAAGYAGYQAHPALLDGAFQAGALLADAGAGKAPFLPVSVARVRAWRPMAAAGHLHVRLRARSAREALWDVTVLAPGGLVCLTLEGCRARRAHRYQPGAALGTARARAYTTVLRAAPHPDQDLGPSPLPSPHEVARWCAGRTKEDQARADGAGGDGTCGGGAGAAERAVRGQRRGRDPVDTEAGVPDGYREQVRQARELAGHFGAAALAALLGEPGTAAFNGADLAHAGMRPEQEPLALLLLDAARTQGLVEPVTVPTGQPAWRFAHPARPRDRLRALARHSPQLAAELALAAACGTRLADVLRGRCDPALLLTSDSHRHLLEELHTEGRLYRHANRTARCALRALLRQWPADRPLRVLEVGAGTCGTTAALLPLLPPERTRYLCTDAGDASFPHARRRLAAYDFVEYRVLDLDLDPVAQGFAEGGFDLVVAHDVLHATDDLRRTLRHLARTLADGGHLLAAETHDPVLLALTHALRPDFWQYRDGTLRTEGPLLSAAGWTRLLTEEGWDTPGALPDAEPPDAEPPEGDGAGRAGSDGGVADAEGVGDAAGAGDAGKAAGAASAHGVRSVILARRPARAAHAARPGGAGGAGGAGGLGGPGGSARRTVTSAEVVPSTPARPASPGPGGTWIVAAEASGARLATGVQERMAAAGLAVRETVLGTGEDAWSALLTSCTGPVNVLMLLGDPSSPDGTRGRTVTDGPPRTVGRAHPDEHRPATRTPRPTPDPHADPDPTPGVDPLLDRAAVHTAALRAFASAAAGRDEGRAVALWLVTPPAGVLPSPERPVAPSAAVAWGEACRVGDGHPGVTVRRISLDTSGTPEADADRLCAELTRPGGDTDILLTPAGRFVARLREGRDPRAAREPRHSPGTEAGHDPRDPADTVTDAPQPGPDDVVIAVHAAALDHTDVPPALSAEPDAPESDAPEPGAAGAFGPGPGRACAGVVTGVGSRVTGFAPGDRVFGCAYETGSALAPATTSMFERTSAPPADGISAPAPAPTSEPAATTRAAASAPEGEPGPSRVADPGHPLRSRHPLRTHPLRPHAVLPAALVARVPDGMGLCAAATLPWDFLTVHHALARVARLAAGETLLVHGGACGVGLAALEYARQAGARVVATTRSPAERDLLRLLGARHVLAAGGSLAERIRSCTDGRGADVVLNPPGGEAIGSALEALAPGGRLVDLGASGRGGEGRLPAAPFGGNVTFAVVDMARLAADRPDEVADVFDEVVRHVADGVYRPLPHHVWPAGRLADAVTSLRHARHVGKAVVSPVGARAAEAAGLRLDPDAAYLVTGGLTGFGAATARRLAARGARHLHLVAVDGEESGEAGTTVGELRARGVDVTVHTADAADAAAMKKVLTVADSWANPLRGVVHAAGPRDEAPPAGPSGEAAAPPLSAGARGAHVLDGLTRSCRLDFFVLFSLRSPVQGGARRSGRAVADPVLAALARARRSAGLPALAVTWCGMPGAGHDGRHAAAPHAPGLVPPHRADVLDVLEDLLAHGDDVALVATADAPL